MAENPELPIKNIAGSAKEPGLKIPKVSGDKAKTPEDISTPERILLDSLRQEEEQEEEESRLNKKVKEKVSDSVKEKAKELAGIGDEKEGKKELVDRIIARDNERIAKKAATQSGLRTDVGVPTQSVSTVTGQPPPSPASLMEMSGPSAKATADPGAEKMASRAGRARAAAGTSDDAASRFAKSTSGAIDELIGFGKTLATEVVQGMKNSKNIRAVGLAALMGTAGFASGKAKDRQQKVKQEFNRQQAIRQQLMKDG